MKNKYLNIIIIFLLTVIVLYFSLKDNYYEIITLVLNVDIKWIILSYLLVLSYTFLKSIVTNDIINKFVHYDMKKMFSLQLMIFFFNAITPFSTGGQPFQVYVLSKNKVPISEGTNSVIQETIIHQMAFMVVGLLMLIINYIFKICELNHFLNLFLIAGFLANALIVFLLFMVSYGKKIDNLLIKFIINIFTKLNIIKNKQEKINKWNKYIEDFTVNSKTLLKDKFRFIKLLSLNILALICLYLVPLTILFSLGDNSFGTIESLVIVTFVSIISCYIPSPGGTGGQEYVFTLLFGTYLTNPLLGSLMILWRFITYYLPMIVGAIVFNFNRRKMVMK